LNSFGGLIWKMTIRELAPRVKIGRIELFGKVPCEAVDVSDGPRSFNVWEDWDSFEEYGVAVQVQDSETAVVVNYQGHHAQFSEPLRGSEINENPVAKKVIRWTEK
jgi:hypothetical protein